MMSMKKCETVDEADEPVGVEMEDYEPVGTGNSTK